VPLRKFKISPAPASGNAVAENFRLSSRVGTVFGKFAEVLQKLSAGKNLGNSGDPSTFSQRILRIFLRNPKHKLGECDLLPDSSAGQTVTDSSD
jgi:hypothetical protein